jgi:hypothetical protein
MANVTAFEAASLGVARIKVHQLDNDLNETIKEYKLCLDMNAQAHVLELIDRDLTELKNWQNLSGIDISSVCWCAFERFHPEMPLKEVRQVLSPANMGATFNMLLELTFPGILERLAKIKPEGESQPNPPCATS